MVTGRIIEKIPTDPITRAKLLDYVRTNTLRYLDEILLAEIDGLKFKLASFTKINIAIALTNDNKFLQLFDNILKVDKIRIEFLTKEVDKNIIEIPVNEIHKLYKIVPYKTFVKYMDDVNILCYDGYGRLKDCNDHFKKFIKYFKTSVVKQVESIYYVVQLIDKINMFYLYAVRLIFKVSDAFLIMRTLEYSNKPLDEFIQYDLTPYETDYNINKV